MPTASFNLCVGQLLNFDSDRGDYLDSSQPCHIPCPSDGSGHKNMPSGIESGFKNDIMFRSSHASIESLVNAKSQTVSMVRAEPLEEGTPPSAHI